MDCLVSYRQKLTINSIEIIDLYEIKQALDSVERLFKKVDSR